jgi:two-component system, OmpR family, KDP operon response regulator KdpE
MTADPPARARATVLVVDDEPPIRKFLRAGLEGPEYAVVEADCGLEGVRQAATRTPDVVLLDLGLPDLDGFEVVRRIREWSRMPIVVLSARGQEEDKIRALDAGADDYVTKPFALGELRARLRVALRHRDAVAGTGEPVLETSAFRVDFAARTVTRDGAEVRLTPIEFKLLAALARHPDRVLTHDQLLREVWGPSHAGERHYLRVYMAQLRHKLEADPGRPRCLITEPGVGYRLRA